jgi:hypothetical protein
MKFSVSVAPRDVAMMSAGGPIEFQSKMGGEIIDD